MATARTLSRKATARLRLYISGGAPNSVVAMGNAKELCREIFGDAHELEIVDMLRFPQRGLDDGVIVTPTLVKYAPLPIQRVVGNLSDRALAAALLRRA